jgi:hypothetical protein
VATGGLVAAMAVAAFLAPMASELDDGLEFVGGRLGFLDEEAPVLIEGPMADYSLRGLPDVAPVTAAAGLIGTLTVFVAGAVLARAFSRGGRHSEVTEAAASRAAGGPEPHAA